MAGCIFLAGASGAIGRQLAPLLIADGWRVVGTTRSTEKAEALRCAGVEPAVLDVFNAAALDEAVANARPDVVFHQLTDLPPGLERRGCATPASVRKGRATSSPPRCAQARHA